MTVRFACEKDIPQMNSLLYQVERVHQQGRPDLFKEGAKKYTDNELKDMLKDKTKPIFAAVDENDVMKGYAFCVFQEHKGDNVLTDIKTLYIDDLCVDENCRGQHIGSVMSTAALGIGAYAGGYVCGKRQRRNGLLSGVLCGVFIFLIIVILSALFSKAAESFSVPAKLVLTLVCAGVGGVVGVNSKSSRF